MRRLKYLFTVAEGEKVTEKCFRRILLSSALGILLCMTCLISSTWALFTTTLVSEGNSIEVGTFTVDVQVNGDAVVQASAENLYEYELATPGQYGIVITNVGTAKGYCQVDILKATEENPEAFFTTGTLYADPEDQIGMSVSFTVEVKESERYSLSITPHWGADPYIHTEVNNVLYTAGVEQPYHEEGDITQPDDGDTSGTDDGDTSGTDDGAAPGTDDGATPGTDDGATPETDDGDTSLPGEGTLEELVQPEA